jgi:hypothetical protein
MPRHGYDDGLRWLCVSLHLDGWSFEEQQDKIHHIKVSTQKRWWRWYHRYGDVRRVRHPAPRAPDISPQEDVALREFVVSPLFVIFLFQVVVFWHFYKLSRLLFVYLSVCECLFLDQ